MHSKMKTILLCCRCKSRAGFVIWTRQNRWPVFCRQGFTAAANKLQDMVAALGPSLGQIETAPHLGISSGSDPAAAETPESTGRQEAVRLMFAMNRKFSSDVAALTVPGYDSFGDLALALDRPWIYKCLLAKRLAVSKPSPTSCAKWNQPRLSCAVLCCAVLCRAVLCCAVLCHAMPCSIVPCRSCCAALHCTVVYCAVLCRPVLCCAVLPAVRHTSAVVQLSVLFRPGRHNVSPSFAYVSNRHSGCSLKAVFGIKPEYLIWHLQCNLAYTNHVPVQTKHIAFLASGSAWLVYIAWCLYVSSC